MKFSRFFPTLVRFLGVLVVLAGSGLADYKQAVQYYSQQRYDKAIQELKPELDLNPEWEFGHRLMGLSYLNLKNNALAIASLTRAVQLKSTAFPAYQGLGQAYFNMQKFDNCVRGTGWTWTHVARCRNPLGFGRSRTRHWPGMPTCPPWFETRFS